MNEPKPDAVAGIPLIDYFAGMAMAEIVAKSSPELAAFNSFGKDTAVKSYSIAQAMIKERQLLGIK